jgi:glutathione S-transferase
MSRFLDVASAYAAQFLRLPAGVFVAHAGARPDKLLELYEFEACPFCRKVRELLTTLDLDALVYPCPKNGSRWRAEVVTRGGKAQFPYLVDPNTDTSMYESDAILRYLAGRYGDGTVPLALRLGPWTIASGSAGALLRWPKGARARPSRAPDGPLELWAFEASPYCRIVRDALCELELPYVLHTMGKRSPKRAAFREKHGKLQFPYLEDPNTGAAMFESAAIVEYLQQTYGI